MKAILLQQGLFFCQRLKDFKDFFKTFKGFNKNHLIFRKLL